MKQYAKEYYLDKDYNCAETTIRLVNDRFHLGLSEDSMKLLSGFGGGMGCEKTCGALCSGIAAISRLTVGERAHATEGFSDRCAAYVSQFEQTLGSCVCSELKEKYHTEDTRCLRTVELSAELLEAYLAELTKAEEDPS